MHQSRLCCNSTIIIFNYHLQNFILNFNILKRYFVIARGRKLKYY